MLKAIVNYFWGASETDLTLDEAYDILESHKDTEEKCNDNVTEIINDYSCFQRTGTITSVDGNNFTIDDTYKFRSNLENLAIGCEVSFTIYTTEGEVKVSDVQIQDDWFCQKTNEKTSWCQRTIICKVLKREGRQLFLTPNNINFDLTDVSTEFIPLVGDWVELDAKVELDETISDLSGKILEIEKIRPLKCYISEGCIKQWSSELQEGVIDRTVFFNHESLNHGYIPFIGDRIIAEIIESDQGMYNKRALKIIPQSLSNKKIGFNKETLPKFDVHHQDVLISENILIRSNKLGVKEKFMIKLSNNGANNLTILNISLPSTNSQCILTKPGKLNNMELAPGQYIEIEGICTTKYVGTTKELILFTFPKFNIGRWITVKIDLNNENNYTRFKNTTFAQTKFNNNSFNRIKGRKVTSGPRFVSRRLPDYPVPQKLIDLASKCDKKDLLKAVREVKPCLTAKFQFNIYEDRFHTLLHLEEICELEAIKSYSQDYTCFIKNGEYLMLEIENLGEKRPSLMIGDRIIAKNPYDSEAHEYEGFIHKIEAKHVYLKFAHAFHDEYDGEDVSVMAISSRATYRRMHQAVGLSVQNLGAAFLFPSKLIIKNPQVDFDLNEGKIDCNNVEVKFPECRSGAVLNALKLHINSKKNSDYSLTNGTENKLMLEWYNNNLNYYQKEAVRNILVGAARPLPYVIYGPPGTGKTVTLVESILQILRLVQHSRIVVATPSNSAANLMALRLIDSGVLKPGDLIRLVGYRYIAEDILPTELIPYSGVADIAKEGTVQENPNFSHNGITLSCNSSVIGRHRITVATCATLGVLFSMNFPKGHFTHVIIDEAGQAKEPEIMIPVSLIDVSSGQVILAGDPCQLGPVILSNVATECGLGETYLDRMLSRYPYIRDMEGFPKTEGYDPRLITKLVYNYRSLPNILNMSSKMFYNGQLISTISEVDSIEAHLLESLKEILPERSDSKIPAVVFHGVIGQNCQSSDSPSWFNANEASQIFFYINELYRLGLKSKDIGIISPYLKQVKLIRSLLNEAEFEVPKVGTVEDFQGHERYVILLTTVRSSENFIKQDLQFHLGFTSQKKRLNVAITRAQALMIIVGNPHLLCKDPHWRTIIKYCMENGAYCGCDLENF